MKKQYYFFLLTLGLLLLITLPVLLPYFHPGYFPTHDGEWAVVRLGEMFREVKDLQIPPRFSGNLNFGYGYPLFNFAYPMPYYLGLLLYFPTHSFIISTKLLFAGSVVLSAIAMYLASSEIWQNKWAGFISAVLYVYFPYRLVDLFVRGSVGECLSLVLFPLILYLITKLARHPPSTGLLALASLAYASLVMTHNISAVLFSLILLPYLGVLIYLYGKNLLKPFSIFIVLSVLLSAFFWLPALGEKHLIALSHIPIADRSLYFVRLPQLLFSPWGYGTPTEKNGFTYQLGWPFIFIFLGGIAIFLLVRHKKKEREFQSLYLTLSVVSLVLFLSMFSFATVFWKLPLLSEINYPWTMLLPLGFLGSLLAGFIVREIAWGKYYGLTLAALAMVLYLPYAHPSMYISRSDGYYLTNEATTTSSDELMPLWVKQKPTTHAPQKAEIISGQGEIFPVSLHSQKMQFTLTNQTPVIAQVNTIYYPGWKAIVDGKGTEISYNNPQGVIQVHLPTGSHALSLKFGETPLRLLSDLLTVVGGVLSLYMLLSDTYRKRLFVWKKK